MDSRFFERPILNSPYAYPARHWELDDEGQPTQDLIERRRPAKFLTPIPSPRKRKSAPQQQPMVFTDEQGVSTERQQYDPTPVINELRHEVDRWRELPNSNHWGVSPETARLLRHWRTYEFGGVRRSSARSKPSRRPSG